MTLPKKLEERMAYRYWQEMYLSNPAPESSAFKAGFLACYTELLPLIEVLKHYGLEGNWMPGPSTWRDRSKPIQSGIHTSDLVAPACDGGHLAREALKKIGVEE